jgi:hypothetical protein
MYKPKVSARAYISPKSWKNDERIDDRLLKHEYGHYLIGVLCALKFQ